MSARFALLLLLWLAVSACRAEPEARCFEGACLNVPAEASFTSEGHRHTIRAPQWSGWIDVQSFEPSVSTPDDAPAVADLLVRRHTMAGNASAMSTRQGQLAGRTAAIEDADIHWRGTDYHRRTYLFRSGTRWLVVDETAPAARFAEADAELDSVLKSAVLQQGT